MRDLLQKIQQQHCQSLPATQRPFCLWLEEDSCAGGLISFVIEVSTPGVAEEEKPCEMMRGMSHHVAQRNCKRYT